MTPWASLVDAEEKPPSSLGLVLMEHMSPTQEQLGTWNGSQELCGRAYVLLNEVSDGHQLDIPRHCSQSLAIYSFTLQFKRGKET